MNRGELSRFSSISPTENVPEKPLYVRVSKELPSKGQRVQAYLINDGPNLTAIIKSKSEFSSKFCRSYDTFMNFKYLCSFWSKSLCCLSRSLADKAEACYARKVKQIEAIFGYLFAWNLDINTLKWLNSNTITICEIVHFVTLLMA